MSKCIYNNEPFQLITEFRNSVLPDFQWCKEYGIKHSTFYSWKARLCKKRISILDSPKHCCPAPLRNEAVKLDLVPDTYPERDNELEQNAPCSCIISTACNTTVEITTENLCIRFTNDVCPEIRGTILSDIWEVHMVSDISRAVNIYTVCSYTDYPRSIIIREDFCNILWLQLFFKNFSNNYLSCF